MVVNLTSPAPGEPVPTDAPLTVGGLARLDAGRLVSVTLSSLGGLVLAESVAEIESLGAFQTQLAVPVNIAGTVNLNAAVLDETGRIIADDTHPLNLTVDVEGEERYLTLYHPIAGGQAVSGYHLFFDGRTLFPENNLIRVAIRDAACQEELARQSYRLRGSGYWQGFVVVPRDLVGAACAVASFGAPNQPQYWREFHVPIDVLPRDDEQAVALKIGNPPAEAEVSRGQTLMVYGTAWNAPRNIVNVSILLENGRVLNEGIAVADGFGYWEESLFVSASAQGPAEVLATIGIETEDHYAIDRAPIEIGP
ncbi:MAG: hypothetical protein R3300_20510 [Candidatus Promineifilaceae bacterium]|nr:hypothetical protein [Candidatus Promineifilaceae bacterium]